MAVDGLDKGLAALVLAVGLAYCSFSGRGKEDLTRFVRESVPTQITPAVDRAVDHVYGPLGKTIGYGALGAVALGAAVGYVQSRRRR